MISNGYTITKKAKTDFNHILITSGIVLILSSIFIPLFLLVPIQQLLFHPEGYWLYEPTRTAYIVFISSLSGLSIMCFVSAWLSNRGGSPLLIKSLMGFSLLVSLTFILLSVNQYHYVDQKGIHINPLFSFEEKHYSWSDVKDAKQTQSTKMGVSKDKNIHFEFQNGDEYNMVLNSNVLKARVAIIYELRENGIDIFEKS
ncbi:hypothetical protein LS684_12885 [Cytobacillus spongiae]|jgi:hypothetical protein|uniref:hypothetical protein n=1 Tax=Cytobacillus spongiae TaxID=2901381 RepID=UPI001F2839DD|nr:hypothetical protein [Cytobacillus spongiae]UII54562.1 hypothetical protein LS684_12885 [Cytobacillus spongiae]